MVLNKMGRKRKYTCEDRFFETIDTEEKAYWLGFTFADGCITTNNKKLLVQYWLSFSDKEHLEKLNNSISGSYPINVYKYSSGYSEGKGYRCNLCIKYETMAKDLINHGCVQNKSLILTFPKLRKNLVHHFIRGYFDGDGSIFINNYKNRGVLYTRPGINICGTKEFLETLSIYLDYSQCIYKEKRKSTNTYTYKVYGNKRVLPILNYLYKDASIYLDRKHKLFKELIHE